MTDMPMLIYRLTNALDRMAKAHREASDILKEIGESHCRRRLDGSWEIRDGETWRLWRPFPPTPSEIELLPRPDEG